MKNLTLTIISIISAKIITIAVGFNGFLIWNLLPIVVFYFATKKYFNNWNSLKIFSKICLTLLAIFLVVFPVLISIMWIFDIGEIASNSSTSAITFIFIPLIAFTLSLIPYLILLLINRNENKNKTPILITIAVMLALIGGWYFLRDSVRFSTSALTNSCPLNTTYLVDGESFTLIDGSAEKEIAPNSATKNTLTMSGDPFFGDIDGDGDEDAVVILSNNTGGSGTFYYAAIAANLNGEYKGTDAIFLGDRIEPRKVSIEENTATVNYADRLPEETFADKPSVEKSVHLQLDKENLRLKQVQIDFEGEADPDVMTLDMHTWRWNKTVYNDDTELVPNDLEAFTITFESDSAFFATTDCNTLRGTYKVNNSNIIFGSISKTKMFCEDSQEQEFIKMLNEIQSFLFTSHGELIFDLKFDSGSAIFN